MSITKAQLRMQVNSRCIGFDPDRMKTVHIANGLFREILGGYYANDLLNRLTVRERRRLPKSNLKRAKWQQHSSRVLLGQIEAQLPPTTQEEMLDKLRRHLEQHLDADSAVFDLDDGAGCAYSSMTQRLVTNDKNDNYAGGFLGRLLKHDFGDGPSPVVQRIEDALSGGEDPMSALATALSPVEEQLIQWSWTYGDLPYDELDQLIATSSALRQMRVCLDRLASYYPGRLSPQRFLRLLVILGSITLIRYLMTLFDEQLGSNGSADPRYLALLIDAEPNGTSRIRLASRATYIRLTMSLQQLYASWLSQWVLDTAKADSSVAPDVSQVAQVYNELLSGSQGKKKIFPERHEPLPVNLADLPTVTEAAAYAGRNISYNLLVHPDGDNFLTGFVRDVGVRCGLLKPRSSRQKVKHASPQADTLEVLVLALLRPSETDGITLEEFAKRLWNNYGLLFGGLDQGSDDLQLLRRLDVREANQDDLNRNSDAFVSRLVALGLARAYSDGLVLVQYPS